MNQCSNCCEYFENLPISHKGETFCSPRCFTHYKESEVRDNIRKYKRSNPKEAKVISIVSSTAGMTIAVLLCPFYFMGRIGEFLGNYAMELLRYAENLWFKRRMNGGKQ